MLNRIIGRVRNMAVRPGGERFWPAFGGPTLRRHAPIEQLQLVQHEPDRIEARVVASRPFQESERNALTQALQDALGFRYRIDFTFLDAIERGPGGKFEEFRCLVEP